MKRLGVLVVLVLLVALPVRADIEDKLRLLTVLPGVADHWLNYKALHLLADRADQGDAWALFIMKSLMRAEFEDRVRWLTERAEQGDALAQEGLGLTYVEMYIDDIGGPQELVEGLKWLYLARELRDEDERYYQHYYLDDCGTPEIMRDYRLSEAFSLAPPSQADEAQRLAGEWMEARGLEPSEYLGSLIRPIQEVTSATEEQPSDL